MANLITNKHKKLEQAKKPTGFLKRVSARKLRRLAIKEISATSRQPGRRSTKHSARKRTGVCPICLGRLSKIARMTRYARTCDRCKATLVPGMRCRRCGTCRVWRGKGEFRCKGCGNVV